MRVVVEHVAVLKTTFQTRTRPTSTTRRPVSSLGDKSNLLVSFRLYLYTRGRLISISLLLRTSLCAEVLQVHLTMADNWDDDDDDWDVDDDQLDDRLGLKKVEQALPTFDDEEDLAVKEKAEREKREQESLKKKGTALAAKKRAEQEQQEELELARKAMELEAEEESNMTPDELRALKQRQIEEADNALTDDLFGGVDSRVGRGSAAAAAAASSDKLVLKDIKDHLRHARRVSEALKAHGKIPWAASLIKELIQESKDVLDDAAITDIIKTCNVIKNEKVQAQKRKVKGQAQKSKKVDKVAEAKAKKIQIETFGDNDKYDEYDEIGADYEDAFF